MTSSSEARWPHDARSVVAITVDLDGPSVDEGFGRGTEGRHAAGIYAVEVGVDSFLHIFKESGVVATFFVPGYDAEQFPWLIRRIVAAGHEVAAHGYLHEEQVLDPRVEERLLVRTHRALTRLAAKPQGWRSPGGNKGPTTLDVLTRLGYRYDSSDEDADLPYLLDEGGDPSRRLIEVPNDTHVLDDYPYYRQGTVTPSQVQRLWTDEFDAVHAESGMFVLTIHPRSDWGSGTPARAAAVAGLLAHIRSHSDATFVRLGELAEWWRQGEATR